MHLPRRIECDLKTGERLQKTTENVGYRICKELDFDILLTGHQHMSVDGQYVHGTYVVQPLENAKEYHYLEAERTKDGLVVRSEKRVADGANAVGALCEKYAAEEERVQSWLDQPIGHLSRGASSRRKSGKGAARFADCRFFKPDTVTFFRRTAVSGRSCQ